MEPITRAQLFILCVGIGQAWVVKTQDVRFPPQEKTDSLTNPLLMKQRDEILRFERTVQDIGILTEDDVPRVCSFTYTNVGKAPAVIIRVRTTCGCTAADVYMGKVLPDETRTIMLTYHLKNHPGAIDTNTFVYLSSSDKAPVVRLTLIGNVIPGADEWVHYPYAMGKLRLKQSQLEFREVAAGKQSSERILYGNGGDKPMRSSAFIIPKFATFCTEPEAIQLGNETDIVVTVNASLIPAEKGKPFTFPVILEGVDARPSDRTLNIRVNCIKQR